MDTGILVALGAVVLFILIIISASVKIIQEYERAVVFRLGRLVDELQAASTSRPSPGA